MISLLIADDEKVIRESLATCIDWKQMGINVVACCANGVDALDASIDHSPNIVLTDIKMPGLDGLELIRRIHAINEDTEFIILSGFREFDFAKQAIDLGVRQYLLKPISEEQIIQAVDDAIEYVAEKQKIRESMMQQTQLQRQLRRYYLQQLQYSLFLDHERFSETAAYYSEHFAAFDERFTLIRIRAISLEAACDLVPRLTSHINRDENNKITEFIYGQETLAAIVRNQAYHSAEEMQRLAGAAQLSLEPFDKLSTPALELRNALCCYSHIILIDSFGKISNLYSTSIAMDSVKNLPEDLVRLACDGQTDVWKRKLEQHLWNIRELHALRSSVAQIISGGAFEARDA